MQVLITLQSIHKVLKAEKILLKKGCQFELIPTPRDISHSCGMCIRMETTEDELKEATKLLREAKLEYNYFKKD